MRHRDVQKTSTSAAGEGLPVPKVSQATGEEPTIRERRFCGGVLGLLRDPAYAESRV